MHNTIFTWIRYSKSHFLTFFFLFLFFFISFTELLFFFYKKNTWIFIEYYCIFHLFVFLSLFFLIKIYFFCSTSLEFGTTNFPCSLCVELISSVLRFFFLLFLLQIHKAYSISDELFGRLFFFSFIFAHTKFSHTSKTQFRTNLKKLKRKKTKRICLPGYIWFFSTSFFLTFFFFCVSRAREFLNICSLPSVCRFWADANCFTFRVLTKWNIRMMASFSFEKRFVCACVCEENIYW